MIRVIKRRKGQEMQEHAWNSPSLLQSLSLVWKNWGPNGFLRTGWYLIRSPGVLACSSRPLSSHSLHFPLGISNKKASPVSAPVILETLEDSKGRISLASTDLRSPLPDTNDCREVHGFRMKWAGPDSLKQVPSESPGTWKALLIRSGRVPVCIAEKQLPLRSGASSSTSFPGFSCCLFPPKWGVGKCAASRSNEGKGQCRGVRESRNNEKHCF